jgi:hypothetical protein
MERKKKIRAKLEMIDVDVTRLDSAISDLKMPQSPLIPYREPEI